MHRDHPIAHELRAIESSALAIEAGRVPRDAELTIDSLTGVIEALPLARQWKQGGVASNLRMNTAAVHALRTGSPQTDTLSQNVYRFVRAAGTGAESLTLEGFWLELRKALTAWGIADPGSANSLVGACREMQDNVLQHSGQPDSGFCGFKLGTEDFEVGVVDSGMGLTRAFLEANPGAPLDAMVLLEAAVLHGKSRLSDQGRGTGFATLLRALRRLDAVIRVRSDDVSLTLTPKGGAQYDAELKQEAKLSGFVVCARLSRVA